MNGNAAMKDNRRALKRIVTLLFAFASLAERVSTRHHLLRASVLWLLRSAETIAWDFVMDMALEAGASAAPAIPVALRGGDTAADAMRLAESFRALAIALNRLAGCNPGRRGICITKTSIALVACAKGGNLASGMCSWREVLCLASSGHGVERHDSS